jgi:hypothetical protein
MSKQTAVEWFMGELLGIEGFSPFQLKEIETAYLKAREFEHRKLTEDVAEMFAKIDNLGVTKGLRDYMEGRYQDVINYKKQNFGGDNE